MTSPAAGHKWMKVHRWTGRHWMNFGENSLKKKKKKKNKFYLILFKFIKKKKKKKKMPKTGWRPEDDETINHQCMAVRGKWGKNQVAGRWTISNAAVTATFLGWTMRKPLLHSLMIITTASNYRHGENETCFIHCVESSWWIKRSNFFFQKFIQLHKRREIWILGAAVNPDIWRSGRNSVEKLEIHQWKYLSGRVARQRNMVALIGVQEMGRIAVSLCLLSWPFLFNLTNRKFTN